MIALEAVLNAFISLYMVCIDSFAKYPHQSIANINYTMRVQVDNTILKFKLYFT